VPVAVSGGLTFSVVAAGALHTCGVVSAGAATCWGANDEGQLGNGSLTSRWTPVAVSGGVTFSALTANGVHTCGLTNAGVAFCWGYNDFGQLGRGTFGSPYSTVPVAVAPFTASAPATAVMTSAGLLREPALPRGERCAPSLVRRRVRVVAAERDPGCGQP